MIRRSPRDKGTVALEMLEEPFRTIDTLVVPIGGGGLLSGMGTAARGINPDIELVGVQAELYPSMYALLNDKQMPCEGDTLAEGIAVKVPGEFTSRGNPRHCRRHFAGLRTRTGNGGQPAPADRKDRGRRRRRSRSGGGDGQPEKFKGKNVGIVLSGGNIDTRLLANVLLRDLARSGRLARCGSRCRTAPARSTR
jgi:threonine dehydratase